MFNPYKIGQKVLSDRGVCAVLEIDETYERGPRYYLLTPMDGPEFWQIEEYISSENYNELSQEEETNEPANAL